MEQSTGNRILLGLLCIIVATGILYWLVQQEHAAGAKPGETWKNLPIEKRAIAIVAFLLSAWGLGSVIDGVGRHLKQRPSS